MPYTKGKTDQSVNLALAADPQQNNDQLVYDQNFFWGEGVVDGERGSSEGCLKWGGGGSLRGLSNNI